MSGIGPTNKPTLDLPMIDLTGRVSVIDTPPVWLQLQACRILARGERNWDITRFSSWYFLAYHVLEQNGFSLHGGILDHSSIVTNQDGDHLIGEPYGFLDEEAMRLSALLECECRRNTRPFHNNSVASYVFIEPELRAPETPQERISQLIHNLISAAIFEYDRNNAAGKRKKPRLEKNSDVFRL